MTERVEHLAEDVTLHLGDCRAILPTLPRADIVMTSPPYEKQRDYGQKIDDWRALVSGAFKSINAVDDAQLLVNLGLIYRDGEVVPYWQPFLDDMRQEGWRFFGWYVWDQGPGRPGTHGGRLAPAHEFVFHLNRQAREPNKIVPCLHAGKRKTRGPKSGFKTVDGGNSGWSRAETITQDAKIGDSVIRVMRQRYNGGAIEADHPAVYPVDLPFHLIESFSARGDLVLDPFMGSGTTGVAAIELGRKFIGIEKHPPYFDIACWRLSEAVPRPDMFTPARAKPPWESTG